MSQLPREDDESPEEEGSNLKIKDYASYEDVDEILQAVLANWKSSLTEEYGWVGLLHNWISTFPPQLRDDAVKALLARSLRMNLSLLEGMRLIRNENSDVDQDSVAFVKTTLGGITQRLKIIEAGVR